MKRARLATAGLLVVLIACAGGAIAWWWNRPQFAAVLPWNDSRVAFKGDSQHLQESVIVPTLDTPMPEGKNVIWCATFQMAWDRLRDDVIGEPVQVEGAEEVAGRLNRGQVPSSDLPEGCYYAAAGFVADGIMDQIRREMQERFHKEPMEFGGDEALAVAYGYLHANLPFTLPYFENDEGLLFKDAQGRETKVTSFGIRRKDEGGYLDLRKQAEVLYCRHKDDKLSGRPIEYALDLCRDSKPNQIIVARVPRQKTLQAAWDDLSQKMTEHPAEVYDQLQENSFLLVPNLKWSVSHHFTKLEKKLLNRGFEGTFISTALQTIDFQLDRSGVELQSEAAIVYTCDDPWFVFDGPFLIVLRNRSAERPFFMMWVDNAELLVK